VAGLPPAGRGGLALRLMRRSGRSGIRPSLMQPRTEFRRARTGRKPIPERGLRPGANMAWLDQFAPMYRKVLLRPEVGIGIVGSTNRRFRALTVFRRLEEQQ
jgi:hypothetical protein